MIDRCGRTIDYLRVSITDRCNLRCRYCMPSDLPKAAHASILSYEEIQRLCGIFCELGIQHIRVTGGEPLVRKGCMGLLQALRGLPGLEALNLTTNGVLLSEHIPALAALPIDSLNISLDTLRSQRYKALTGYDGSGDVLRAIRQAVEAGMRVKLNCVVMRGVNEDELPDMAKLAQELPVDVRFIELMPLGAATAFEAVPGEEVLARLRREDPALAPVASRGAGPARYFASPSLQGRIGFINALTDHFCEGCNRLRLSSQGFLKLCLFHNDGIDLRTLLRTGAGDRQIREAIEVAIAKKPKGHAFGQSASELDGLSSIGG